MFVPESIKKYFLKKHLKNEFGQLNIERSHVNWVDVKTVGVIFDATEIETFGAVKSFTNKLKQQGKKVWLLGYINATNANNVLSFPFFSKGDLDWKGVPENFEVERFIDKQPDILLNAYFEPILPLYYVSVLSKAKRRVGVLMNGFEDAAELLLQLEEKNFDNFFKEINRYA